MAHATSRRSMNEVSAVTRLSSATMSSCGVGVRVRVGAVCKREFWFYPRGVGQDTFSNGSDGMVYELPSASLASVSTSSIVHDPLSTSHNPRTCKCQEFFGSVPSMRMRASGCMQSREWSTRIILKIKMRSCPKCKKIF